MKTSLFLAACLAIGCSSPKPPIANAHAVHAQDVTHAGNIEPQDDDERAVLEKMWELPDDTAQKIGTLSVQAQAPYRSASGRVCRNLTLQKRGAELLYRLACTEAHPPRDKEGKQPPFDERPWVFVPTVYAPQMESKKTTASTTGVPNTPPGKLTEANFSASEKTTIESGIKRP